MLWFSLWCLSGPTWYKEDLWRRSKSYSRLFTMESTLGTTHHFSMRREYPKGWGDFLAVPHSWSEMGLECQLGLFVVVLSLLGRLALQNIQEGWRPRLRKGQEESSSEKLESENCRNYLWAEITGLVRMPLQGWGLNSGHLMGGSKSWERTPDGPQWGCGPLAVLGKVSANPLDSGYWEEAPDFTLSLRLS